MITLGIETSVSRYSQIFDSQFARAVAAACGAWGYRLPAEEFHDRVRERVTEPIIEWLGYGFEADLIIEKGFQFNLIGNSSNKGPYKWFSRRSNVNEPQCNWEYFIQVALFCRLTGPCAEKGFRLTFEDGLMDLAVRNADELLWCIEVKEKPRQLTAFLSKLDSFKEVAMDAPDRGNDTLRKAKYLIRHRPPFFSGEAIYLSRHFKVSYPTPNSYKLSQAEPPLYCPETPPAQ